MKSLTLSCRFNVGGQQPVSHLLLMFNVSSKEVFTSADKCVNIFGRLCLLDAKVPKLGIEAYKYPTQ